MSRRTNWASIFTLSTGSFAGRENSMAQRASLQMSQLGVRWAGVATAAVVAAAYFGTGVFDHDICSPTEPAVSGVVWNMFRHGSLAVPRIDAFPYLEKPPLAYWLSWLSCEATGKLTAACLRLPSAVFGVLSLCVFYWIARRRNDRALACVTVLLAATSVQFYQFSHRAAANILVVFFVFLCFALFVKPLLQTGGGEFKTLANDLAFAGALAVSFYAKNFFIHLFVLPPVILFLLYKRQFQRALRSIALVAVLTALVVLPWVLALYQEGGWEYLRVVFFDNTFGRFFNFSDPARFKPGPLNDAFTVERGATPFLYLGALLWVPAPWSLVFLASVIWLLRQPGGDDLRFFLKLAIVVVPLTLTLSASRVADYLVPLLFVMLLMMGDFLRELFFHPQSTTRLERGLCLANVIVVVSALVIAPLGLGVYLSQPALFGLTPLILLGFAYFAWRVRREWFGWGSMCGFACLATLGTAVTLAASVPLFDAKRSFSPFFEEVRHHLRGRELYTTLLDDKRLPLIGYYLDRRVPIIRDDETLLELLQSGAKVSVILYRKSYQQLKDRLGGIPHHLVAPTSGNQLLVLVNSP